MVKFLEFPIPSMFADFGEAVSGGQQVLERVGLNAGLELCELHYWVYQRVDLMY